MDPLVIGLLMVALLLALVLLGMRIAVALLVVGFIGIWAIRGNVTLAMKVLSITSYNGLANYLFATIPLFVLMGQLVSISNVGRDTFQVAESALRGLRGGLGVATVAANTVFAAVTGVSIASAVVFTKVAVPEMQAHGYRADFAAGTVAGSSVLGMLIPPSLLMIIYGVLAEVSIGKMFIAGVVPGLLLAVGFCVVVLGMARWAPSRVFAAATDQDAAPAPRLSGAAMAVKSLPIVVMVGAVIGGLYSGLFTPTEAGAAGAALALVVALQRRSLGLGSFWRLLTETGVVSVGILTLLLAAGFYGQMLAVAGIPEAIGTLVRGSGLGLPGFLVLYISVVLLMGMVLDSSSILLIIVPIAAPIAQSLGYDLIVFGVVTVIAVEIGLLTPPFGISVFSVHGALKDRTVRLEQVFAGSLPFIAVMLLVLAAVTVFPVLVLR